MEPDRKHLMSPAGDPSTFEKKMMRGESDMKDTHRFTVFLVEDNSDDRNIMLQTLTRSPFVHNVHWFESGDKMLEHFMHEGYYSGTLIHHIPTLVLLDLRIPGTDGMEILKKLKENPLTSDIPVIIVTGNVCDKKAQEAFDLQANAFIAKPLHLDRVHEVMMTGWSWPGTARSSTERG